MSQPTLCSQRSRRAVPAWYGRGSLERGRTPSSLCRSCFFRPRLGVVTTLPSRVATFAGAISVVLALIGFLRWVFVVPPLALMYQEGDAASRTAVAAAWLAQHQYGGALLGEHLGQLLGIGWSITLSIIILRSRVLPRWVGVLGLIVSALYLFNQGDILATALPGFPVFDLAGLIGSTGWGLWVAALGVVLLFRPKAPSTKTSEDADHS